MDFSWTEEQLAHKKAIIEFARQNLNEGFEERDRKAEFSRENWRKCAEFGIIGLPMPVEYGGAAADILKTQLTMEALGYACLDTALIFGINAQMWSVQMPILNFGTEAQKMKYLPATIRGEIIGGHAMSELTSGSDAYSLKTTAVKNENGYVLNGHKAYITNGPVSDYFVVFANVAPEKGMWGVTAFLVDRGTPGLTITPASDKMGLRTIEMGEIILENCQLSMENRLGPEGAGAKMFNSSMEWERSCILACNLGALEQQLERAVQYARARQQFNQPIGKFQSISNRIADMKVRLETARLMIYKIAWLKSQGKSAVMEAAIAKLYLSECAVDSSMDAIRIHGGAGYLTETGIERYLRDSIGGTIYSGTSDIQRNIISRLLGL